MGPPPPLKYGLMVSTTLGSSCACSLRPGSVPTSFSIPIFLECSLNPRLREALLFCKRVLNLRTQDLALSPNILLFSFRESTSFPKFPGFLSQVGLQTELHYDFCHIYMIDFLLYQINNCKITPYRFCELIKYWWEAWRLEKAKIYIMLHLCGKIWVQNIKKLFGRYQLLNKTSNDFVNNKFCCGKPVYVKWYLCITYNICVYKWNII